MAPAHHHPPISHASSQGTVPPHIPGDTGFEQNPKISKSYWISKPLCHKYSPVKYWLNPCNCDITGQAHHLEEHDCKICKTESQLQFKHCNWHTLQFDGKNQQQILFHFKCQVLKTQWWHRMMQGMCHYVQLCFKVVFARPGPGKSWFSLMSWASVMNFGAFFPPPFTSGMKYL